jgi:hypothetical protein
MTSIESRQSFQAKHTSPDVILFILAVANMACDVAPDQGNKIVYYSHHNDRISRRASSTPDGTKLVTGVLQPVLLPLAFHFITAGWWQDKGIQLLYTCPVMFYRNTKTTFQTHSETHAGDVS